MADGFSSEADYTRLVTTTLTPHRSPSPITDKPPPNYSPPSRYRKTDGGENTGREDRRTRARETRRTRRTVRLQQRETHAKIDTSSSSSDGSSIDENYDIASIHGHEAEEHLTLVSTYFNTRCTLVHTHTHFSAHLSTHAHTCTTHNTHIRQCTL